MTDIPVCWRCGTGLDALSLPLTRLDECPDCQVQLHVCRMCSHFDPTITRSCREDDAEEVREKDRANFCDYFRLRNDAFDSGFAAADGKAKSQLGELFGDDSGEDSADGQASEADDLFK
jgi:hypothetical protein